MCVEPKWRKRGEYPRPHNVPQHDGDIVYTEYFECAKRKTLKCEAKLKIFHKKNRNPEKKLFNPTRATMEHRLRKQLHHHRLQIAMTTFLLLFLLLKLYVYVCV